MNAFSIGNTVLLILTLSLGCFKTSAQELISIKESFRLQSQINNFRKSSKSLAYDSSRQEQVDYFASKILCKSYHHDFQGDYSAENIAVATDIDDIFEMWKLSPPHRKNIKGKFKAMCARYVKYEGKIYAVARFYK